MQIQVFPSGDLPWLVTPKLMTSLGQATEQNILGVIIEAGLGRRRDVLLWQPLPRTADARDRRETTLMNERMVRSGRMDGGKRDGGG